MPEKRTTSAGIQTRKIVLLLHFIYVMYSGAHALASTTRRQTQLTQHTLFPLQPQPYNLEECLNDYSYS